MKTSPYDSPINSRKTQRMQQCILSPLPFVTGRLCPHSARPIKTTSTNIVKANSTSGVKYTSKRWPSDRAVDMTSEKWPPTKIKKPKPGSLQAGRNQPSATPPLRAHSLRGILECLVRRSLAPRQPHTNKKTTKPKLTHPTKPNPSNPQKTMKQHAP